MKPTGREVIQWEERRKNQQKAYRLGTGKENFRGLDFERAKAQKQVPGPGEMARAAAYSAAVSFSMTTLKCAVTSLCSFRGTVNSPRVLSGSCSWILRRSISNPFLPSASAMSPDVTEPKSWSC